MTMAFTSIKSGGNEYWAIPAIGSRWVSVETDSGVWVVDDIHAGWITMRAVRTAGDRCGVRLEEWPGEWRRPDEAAPPLPPIGSRWVHYEGGVPGTCEVVAVDGGYVVLKSDNGGMCALRTDLWPGAWRPAPAAPAPIRINNQNEMDAAFGKGFFEMSLHSGKPAIRCSAPTEMPKARVAWAAVADAMATPRGRRVLAVQAVDEAVRRCPAGLVPEAYRVACVAELDEIDSVPGPGWLEMLTRLCARGECEAYTRALAAIRAPLGQRPARWSGGRRW